MYKNKPKYNITDYLNTNKSAPVVKASFGMSTAPDKTSPVVTSAPVVKTAPTIIKKTVVKPTTYSATATPAKAVIGAIPVHVKKPRVLTEKQSKAMGKLKAMGAKMIASNKVFNAKKLK